MKKYLPFAVVILAAIIRITTLPKLLIFTPDEGYISYIVETIVKDFHIIWIGVSILGFEFYMGPFWIYILYPLYAIFVDGPMVMGAVAVSLSIATVGMIFFIGKKMYSKSVGLIASFLYATSTLIIFYDQRPYPPAVPFWTLSFLISLYLTKKDKRWWFVFAFLSGMVFHIHLSIVLLIAVGLYWGISHQKTLNRKIVIISVAIFFAVISPLIAFDYFHKGSNITAPLRAIQGIGKSESSFNLHQRINVFTGSLSRVFYLDDTTFNSDEILYPCNTVEGKATAGKPLISAIVLTLLALFALKKQKNTDNKRLLLLFGLAFLVPFLILPVFNPVEYYLLGFFPIMLLMMSVVIESFAKPIRMLSYALIAAVVVNGSYTAFAARGDFGLAAKQRLIREVQKVVGDEDYILTSNFEGCHGGWRYLFSKYYKAPVRSSDDKSFAWLYPDEVSENPAKYEVVVKETRLQEPVIRGFDQVITQGGFSAYIFE